ncbi:hypothetical protein LXA43DRAFT_998751 [Ganoderma leucocontextum]|nr:hypothetical protein LXA43DRAFT_998751 [Ganoderma leucocontextum]
MSVPLLRQARASHSLSAACRALSRCRCNSSLASQPRHDSESSDSPPVAGPSNSHASSTSSSAQRKLGPATPQDSEVVEPFSRVQSYLASINAAGIEPTLSDLDRYRPECPPVQSLKYAEVYNATLNTLIRSFTKEQLRKFLVQVLGTSRHCSTNRKKADYAESILEQKWKWPKLADVEQAKRDKIEVVTKELPVSVSQLFLILGKDGMDLKRMSQDYDVHISLKRLPKSLALRVEGTRSGVREISEHIASMSQSFTSNTFDLLSPTPIPPDMIERISRLSQAFIEDIPNSPGKVRITAKNAQALEAADRLASRAVHEIAENSCAPMLAYLPVSVTHSTYLTDPLAMFPREYALYPYYSPRELPFSMNTSGTFRLRRVGEWLSGGFREDLDTAEGLARGKGHFVADFDKTVQLKDVLLEAIPKDLTQANMVIRASLGHMLLTRVSKDQRTTLVPPLTGQHPFGKVRKWMANNTTVKMTFVPDLPLPLLSTSPAHQKVIHRLVYHSLVPSAVSDPGKGRLTSTDSVPYVSASAPIHHRKTLSLEIMLEEPKPVDYQDMPHALDDMFSDVQEPESQRTSTTPESGSSIDLEEIQEQQQPPPPISIPILSAVRCWTGVQAGVNVMMPDRPMDLQFTVDSPADLSASQQPPELREYLRELEAFLGGSESQSDQPSPPLQLRHEGASYLLHTNASVRQSEEAITGSRVPGQSLPADEVPLTRALCESILDLESNQKTMRCEIACRNVASEETWQRFLEDCDKLSIMSHRSPNIMPFVTGDEQFI